MRVGRPVRGQLAGAGGGTCFERVWVLVMTLYILRTRHGLPLVSLACLSAFLPLTVPCTLITRPPRDSNGIQFCRSAQGPSCGVRLWRRWRRGPPHQRQQAQPQPLEEAVAVRGAAGRGPSVVLGQHLRPPQPSIRHQLCLRFELDGSVRSQGHVWVGRGRGVA